MKIKQNPFIILLLNLSIIFVSADLLFAQEDDTENEKMAEYREEVRQMVSFLRFSMNVLGDPAVSAKEKDIIINESYLKIFYDEKVQVEDDLVENRDVVTNKDVQAYLKDVDFFFKQVRFEFSILDIADDLNHEGKLFFTVKLMRNLKGITVEGDSMNTDQERYIEVNVDEENKDLRIASIYTTKLSRDEELRIWWAGLSHEWKTFLGVEIEVKEGLRLNEVQEFSDSSYWADDILFTDSVPIIDYVKQAASREVINLSGSSIYTDLKPLDQLKSLRELDISSSAISDLFPIRNLTTLEVLNCSDTKIDDLGPLKYSKSLRALYVNYTPVTSITVIENFENLELLHMEQTVIDSLPSVDNLLHLKELNCSSTNLERLDSVKYLKSLEVLDISNTSVGELNPIADLKNLKKLNLSNTKINSLSPVAHIESLEILTVENSPVDDLSPLKGLDHLKIIYADRSGIELEEFGKFALERPEVDVVFMSEELFEFWENIDDSWADLLQNNLHFDDTVSKEDIHKILKIENLDLRDTPGINDLRPLKYMPLLQNLDISQTSVSDLDPVRHIPGLRVLKGSGSKVTDLSPIRELRALEVIDFQHTTISHISALSKLSNLDSLNFNHTQIKNISVLNDLKGFKIAYFDNSQVTDEDVYALNFDDETSNVIYKSDKLRVWWGNMDDNWQDIFRKTCKLTNRPTSEELHLLVSKRVLDVHGTSIKNLDPIPEFIRLESLSFSDTRITSLYPLIGLKRIKELNCPRNPIPEIEALSSLNSLEVLDLDHTQIKDLKAIRSLVNLRELKFSGTNVKDISPIEGFERLEVLEFSKTRVKQVNALASLNNLKVLKCYNNKISAKKIEEFKMRNPDCEVVFY
ncbi:MAG: hypothetical protein MI975_20775 [Cytophagales bacterium]|nr:hypothetical protein [Cytophagales bacterium]